MAPYLPEALIAFPGYPLMVVLCFAGAAVCVDERTGTPCRAVACAGHLALLTPFLVSRF